MKTTTDTVLLGGSANFLASTNKFMPRVMFAPEDGTGADKTAEEKKAADTAAADADEEKDKAAAELAEAEAAAAALEDSDKDAKTLAADKAKLLREVMDKKAKLKAAETKAAETAAALAAYDGIDPVKVKELVRKEADAEKAAAEAKGDFDRVKAMMVEEHAKEKKTLEDKIAELTQARQVDADTINNLTVGNDFGSSTFIKDSLTLTPSKARALYGAHFEIQDGKTVAFDKPAGKANRTMLVNSSGDPLSFDEAFKRIIDADPDKETLLKAKVAAGAGSSSTQKTTEQKKPANDGVYGVSRIRIGLDTL